MLAQADMVAYDDVSLLREACEGVLLPMGLFIIGWTLFNQVGRQAGRRGTGILGKSAQSKLEDPWASSQPLASEPEPEKLVPATALESHAPEISFENATGDMSPLMPDCWSWDSWQEEAQGPSGMPETILPAEMWNWSPWQEWGEEKCAGELSSMTKVGPEAAVASDLDSALATATASGDAQLADSLLSAGARLCGAAWLSGACSTLSSAGISLRPERAADIAGAFARDGRADLAVDLWLQQCGEIGQPSEGSQEEPPPAQEYYGAALEACVSCGDFEAAARAARSARWRAPGCQAGQAAMLALARWLARRRALCPALECYASVRRASGKADLATHRAVLKACVWGNDMARADDLFQDLVASGLTPDYGTFAAMVRGHRAVGNLEEAVAYFRRMKQHGERPDASLFDAVLDGCLWRNMPVLMEQVLADMEASGVRPSSTTLTTLLRLYGQSCKIDRALAIFEELPRKHGLQVDAHAYGALLSACLHAGRLDIALETFERMSSAGYRAKARTYEALLSACMRQGLLEQSVKLVDEALGLAVRNEGGSAGDDNAHVEAASARVNLDSDLIASLLRLIGSRRKAADLGLPLLGRLERAGCEMPQELGDSLRKQVQTGCHQLPYHQRRSERLLWCQGFGHPDQVVSEQTLESS